jgi:hypothetical protein
MEECNTAQAEVFGIEKTIAEGNRRVEAFEDMVSWDGQQPDFWAVGGKTWRRCTAADVGKTVRVNNKPECKPSESPEAKLIGIAKGWFCCEGSKGQMVTWRRAWIEMDPAEETDKPEDTKGYISIQVGAFYPGEPSVPVVKEDLKTEPAFKKFDLVVVRQPKHHAGPPHLLWLREMDRYDDTVRRVSGVDEEEEYCTLQDCSGDEGPYRFAFSWLKKIEG